MKPEDRVGQTIGIYKVIGIDRAIKGSNRIYKCECIYCGKISTMSYMEITRPSKCTHLNMAGNPKMYGYIWDNKNLGKIFRGMEARCYNEKDKNYHWYGAKGIKICNKWMNNPKSFEEWATSNGYKKGLTIDRIDGEKDYCPENCRWVTNEYNSRYKSTTRVLTVNGESHTGREWADILEIGTNVINNYVRLYGVDDSIEFIKRFLNNPLLVKKRKSKESFFDIYMS